MMASQAMTTAFEFNAYHHEDDANQFLLEQPNGFTIINIHQALHDAPKRSQPPQPLV